MSKPLSREFLLSRKKCCQNGCQNCPYKTMYVPLPFNFNLKIPTHKEGLEYTKKLIKNMEEKEDKLEFEEISLEDRWKIYDILYPYPIVNVRTSPDCWEWLTRAHIPTHKIKIKK